MAKENRKYVYFYGINKKMTEGNSKMKSLLGGKGANLAEMANAGLPVPPGFTISTEACACYSKHGHTYPDGLKEQIQEQLSKLENAMGKKLGDPNDPLLVSVRSGAAISMPGMMDTVLNLGLNDKSVLGFIESTGNARTGWDCYRRFIDMFGTCNCYAGIIFFCESGILQLLHAPVKYNYVASCDPALFELGDNRLYQ